MMTRMGSGDLEISNAMGAPPPPTPRQRLAFGIQNKVWEGAPPSLSNTCVGSAFPDLMLRVLRAKPLAGGRRPEGPPS